MATEKAEFEVELEDDVTPGARKASSSLARLQKRFEKFNKSAAGKAVQKFSSAAKSILTVAATIGAGVAAGVGAMTTAMVDFNQRSLVAFDRLAKHGEVPQELFQRSIDLAKRFGLDIKDTTKQIAKFRALQFNQDQAEALVKMGADMMALGASTEEVSRIFAQLGQIQAKGKLQGEELIVLAENGLSTQLVYENLEKQLGKTREEILKMQQGGAISSTAALKAIGAAILQKTNTKAFGQAGEQVANVTLSGAFGRLKAGFQDLFRRAAVIAEPAIAGAFGPIADTLGRLFEDPRTAEAIGGFVASLGEAVKTALPYVEAFARSFGSSFAETLPMIIEGMSTVVDVFRAFGGEGMDTMQIVKQVAEALGILAAITAGAVVAAAGLATGAVVVLTGVFNYWKAALGGVIDAIGSVVFAFVDFFENISAILDAEGLSIGEKAVALGKALVMGFVNGIRAMAMAPINAIKGVANGVVAAAETVFQIGSPSKVFEDIGRFTVQGFAVGADDEMPTIRGMAGDMGENAISGGFGAAPGGGGGGGDIIFEVHVQMPTGATRGDGERFGRGVADGLRSDRALLRFLEGAALQGGT